MRRKKILQVIERLDVAGAETVVRDLMVNLPASEWETEVCVLQNTGRLGEELHDMGYRVDYLNWKYDTHSRKDIIRKLHALIKARQIDLLHSHGTSAWYFSSFARIGTKVGHCVTLHGFNWGTDNWKMKTMCAVLSWLADSIVIVSDSIREYLKTIPLFALKKVQTVINGVDVRIPESYDKTEKRKSIGLSEDDFVLGSVGRFDAEKNMEMQIRLVHALAPEIPNLKLVVVAAHRGSYPSVEELAGQLNVRNRIIFTGLRRDVPELLNTFDIFIMTSFSEGTSLALLEAMSSGIAPVVSNVGGNIKIISHGDNGILFDVHDLESLKNHISDLYRDKQKRCRLAQCAKKSSEKYNIGSMIQAYSELYRYLIA